MITLGNILVSSIHTGGSGGEERLTENVTLNFSKFKIQYKEQTASGGAGSSPDMQWNIATNAANY